MISESDGLVQPSARERILTALVELVATRGLEAVSVRQVAAQAGVTGGMVQHHFSTKQQMIRAAMAAITENLAELVAEAQTGLPPGSALRSICRMLVPLDDERMVHARIWLAFLARAAVDDDVATEHRQTWQQLEDIFARLLAAAGNRGRPLAVDRAGGALLLATLDGLATGGVVEPDRLPVKRIDQLLSAQLDLLLDAGAR
ncbi:TetR family transcriptional regulator [Tamaricihabitans halophyticus]|uniref:TetR family transcriptional regulator n=1 Tax=Tamaricihabitans halophyticus TaxID=1262583 RepID=A0A4R2QX21_9PSEU|nr:TetR/AcrR family transcriptional regulator [Tamaricihabitans halophyticus]TCP54267.1 TetR family transcriptional regulator [Tamaricihabitans halophyticus]